MKYLKTFERLIKDYLKKYIRPLYKNGDYVILNNKVIRDNNLTDIYENIGVIVGREKHANDSYMYDVDYMNDIFELNNIRDHYILESEIIKKLTKKERNKLNEEIAKYEASKIANKYNL